VIVHADGDAAVPVRPLPAGRVCRAVGEGYGPHRLVADAIAAMAARGLCPVFSPRDLVRAAAGAREILAALHVPTVEAERMPSGPEGGDGP
jgi:hypothetical protein